MSSNPWSLMNRDCSYCRIALNDSFSANFNWIHGIFIDYDKLLGFKISFSDTNDEVWVLPDDLSSENIHIENLSNEDVDFMMRSITEREKSHKDTFITNESILKETRSMGTLIVGNIKGIKNLSAGVTNRYFLRILYIPSSNFTSTLLTSKIPVYTSSSFDYNDEMVYNQNFAFKYCPRSSNPINYEGSLIAAIYSISSENDDEKHQILGECVLKLSDVKLNGKSMDISFNMDSKTFQFEELQLKSRNNTVIGNISIDLQMHLWKTTLCGRSVSIYNIRKEYLSKNEKCFFEISLKPNGDEQMHDQVVFTSRDMSSNQTLEWKSNDSFICRISQVESNLEDNIRILVYKRSTTASKDLLGQVTLSNDSLLSKKINDKWPPILNYENLSILSPSGLMIGSIAMQLELHDLDEKTIVNVTTQQSNPSKHVVTKKKKIRIISPNQRRKLASDYRQTHLDQQNKIIHQRLAKFVTKMKTNINSLKAYEPTIRGIIDDTKLIDDKLSKLTEQELRDQYISLKMLSTTQKNRLFDLKSQITKFKTQTSRYLLASKMIKNRTDLKGVSRAGDLNATTLQEEDNAIINEVAMDDIPINELTILNFQIAKLQRLVNDSQSSSWVYDAYNLDSNHDLVTSDYELLSLVDDHHNLQTTRRNLMLRLMNAKKMIYESRIGDQATNQQINTIKERIRLWYPKEYELLKSSLGDQGFKLFSECNSQSATSKDLFLFQQIIDMKRSIAHLQSEKERNNNNSKDSFTSEDDVVKLTNANEELETSISQLNRECQDFRNKIEKLDGDINQLSSGLEHLIEYDFRIKREKRLQELFEDM